MLGDMSAYGTAIIAALAAIVGGVLAAGSNLVVEARRRHDDRERQKERDQRELRQAVRLVLAELAEIRQAIEQSAKSHLTWRNDHLAPAFAWREYRATLAAHLPISAWRWVELAYSEANNLNWRFTEMNREFETEGPTHFTTETKETLREPFRTVYQAMAELEGTLGEPRGASFGYTGYADLEDLELRVWGPPSEASAGSAT